MSVSRFEQESGLRELVLPLELPVTLGHLSNAMTVTLAPELNIDSSVVIFPNRTLTGEITNYGVRKIPDGVELPDYTNTAELRRCWLDHPDCGEIVYVDPCEEITINPLEAPELALNPLVSDARVSFAVWGGAIALDATKSSRAAQATLTEEDSGRMLQEPEMTDDLRADLYRSLHSLYAFSESGSIRDEDVSMAIASKNGKVQCLIYRSDIYPELEAHNQYTTRGYVIDSKTLKISVTDYGPRVKGLPKSRAVSTPDTMAVALLLTLADDIRRTM